MALKIFRSFLSTVTPFRAGGILAQMKILVDPTTGSPVGVQNPNANGPDGIWTPIDVTAAQIQNPNAVMLADLNATYRLNVAPYTRYQSNGNSLVALTSAADVQGPDGLFGTMIAYSPFTVSAPEGVTLLGTVYVRTVPA